MDAGDGNALPIGVWKHVVMTHDGVNDKIFIDGVKKASKAVTGNLKSTVNPLGIGYDPIDNGGFFNGALDEVQVYNYALTEGEVTALYTTQSLSPAICLTHIHALSPSLSLSHPTSGCAREGWSDYGWQESER